MLGLILLFISLISYFSTKYRYLSYLIYIGFMMGAYGGFNILTDEIIGMKNQDIAIIYTFIISFYLILSHKYIIPPIACLKYYKYIILFLICSIFFSYFHYEFSWYQILQGGRNLLLLFSLPILIRIKTIELEKIFKILYWITFITSILYILQIITGKTIMPYPFEPITDASTGLIRLYNYPPLLVLFLALTFIAPQYFKKLLLTSRIIFFITLICTLGRTYIISSILMILITLYFQGKASKLIKTSIIISLLFIPFYNVISDRFEEGGTNNDISTITKGGFKNYSSNEGGTMTFRIAWVYERFDYLMSRPLGEKIFGLGLISDSQPVVNKMYNFHIGLIDEKTGFPVQLSTADIAYGNLLTQMGFLGSTIYLIFIISLTILFYKNRKTNPLTLITAAQLIIIFIGSLSGNELSDPKSLTFYFIILGTIIRKDKLLFIQKNT